MASPPEDAAARIREAVAASRARSYSQGRRGCCGKAADYLSSTQGAKDSETVADVEVPALPGLGVERGFLAGTERRRALLAARALALQARDQAAHDTSTPHESTAHNLNRPERFQSLRLPLLDGRIARCEHFRDYGDGHELTYFRSELPTLGLPDSWLEQLAALPAVRAEVDASRARLGRDLAAPWRWKLTLNRYAYDAGAGFPWHIDLTSNGAASLILNLGGPGALEFAQQPGDRRPGAQSDHGVLPGEELEPIGRVDLEDGDLLVVTGPARWDYAHRVLPVEGAERYSVVWGVW